MPSNVYLCSNDFARCCSIVKASLSTPLQLGSDRATRPIHPPKFPTGMNLTERAECVWTPLLKDYAMANLGEPFPKLTGAFSGLDLKKLYEARAHPFVLTCNDLHAGVL